MHALDYNKLKILHQFDFIYCMLHMLHVFSILHCVANDKLPAMFTGLIQTKL